MLAALLLSREPVRTLVPRRALAIRCAALLACLIAVAPPAAHAAQAAHAMVVSESEAASKAGLEILRRGGNAVDAACATALAMGVTNAASCGVGGGGFMLIYVAKSDRFYALDYRETAPAAASPTMYLRNGHPDEQAARVGPLAVAVPGEIAGIDAALARLGTMKFSAVAAPAIELTRNGFVLNEHLAREIARTAPLLARDPGLKAVFLNPDGTPHKAGDRIFEKELAGTLERLGDQPAQNFYRGAIADQVAAYMKARGGLITASDLAGYRPVWRAPLSRAYREFEVHAIPPPSSGGVVLEMLGMLGPGKIAGLGVDSPPYLARLIEVMRQGFIDRQDYADPAFVDVPIDALLSPAHIEQARQRALRRAPARPPAAAHDHGTANLCVVDKDGNVVALTTTINTVFGAKLTVSGLGVILNDEMDDFAVAPGVPNVYGLAGAKANEIQPGKRPLSSMTPLIVTKAGKPVLTLGGSGGPTIITGVLQVALDVLDFHLDPAKAEEVARVHQQATPDVVAVESKLPATVQSALEEMGYTLRMFPALGAVNVIEIAPGSLHGAFDPRKGGGATGY